MLKRIAPFLIIGLLLLPAVVSAQDRDRFQYGVTVLSGLKHGFTEHPASKYSPLYNIGTYATARINGADEGAFSWQQHLGGMYDRISYKVQSGDYIEAELYRFLLEPEVLLPTRNDKLQLSVSIGAYYTFFTGAISRSGTASSGNFYSDVDSFGTLLETGSNALIPFVSAGLVYQPNSRCQVGCKIRQLLRNHFEDGLTATYYINHDPHTLALSYQPTFLELSFTYFWKDKDRER